MQQWKQGNAALQNADARDLLIETPLAEMSKCAKWIVPHTTFPKTRPMHPFVLYNYVEDETNQCLTDFRTALMEFIRREARPVEDY